MAYHPSGREYVGNLGMAVTGVFTVVVVTLAILATLFPNPYYFGERIALQIVAVVAVGVLAYVSYGWVYGYERKTLI